MVTSLIIEPFNSGSHKQLVDLLAGCVPDCSVFTLPGKKWHWRARTSALYFCQTIPRQRELKTLFCSSVLNLSELVALRDDLRSAHKIFYFHENQLTYPRQLDQRRQQQSVKQLHTQLEQLSVEQQPVKQHPVKQQLSVEQQPVKQQLSVEQQVSVEMPHGQAQQLERDFQYGYNQILSCLVADEILFNSSFNMESFLSSFTQFFNMMPDFRPKGLEDKIRPKCRVLYFPLEFPSSNDEESMQSLLEKGIRELGGETCGKKRRQDNLVYKTISSSANRSSDKRTTEIDADVVDRCSHSLVESSNILHSIEDECFDIQRSVQNECCRKCGFSVCSDTRLLLDEKSSDEHCLQHDPTHKSQCLPTRQKSLLEISSLSVNIGHSADEGNSLLGTLVKHDDDATHIPQSLASHSSHCEQSVNGLVTEEGPLHIIWPHRWEYDKNPEAFFKVLYRLDEEHLPFHVSVVGQTYTETPECFAEARLRLKDHIKHWGYMADKDSYLSLLRTGSIVISTAVHEFYGVAMLEATFLGCFPLCPNRLSYPEIFPSECLYNTYTQLYKRLRTYCNKPWLASHHRNSAKMDLSRFTWKHLKESYMRLFN